jgi:hypothetical protein
MNDQQVGFRTNGPMGTAVILEGLFAQLPIPEREKVLSSFASDVTRTMNALLIREAQSYLIQMATFENFDAVAFERVRASVVGLTSMLLAQNQLGYEYQQEGERHRLLQSQKSEPSSTPMN